MQLDPPTEPVVQREERLVRQNDGLTRAGAVELDGQPSFVLAAARVGQVPARVVREP